MSSPKIRPNYHLWFINPVSPPAAAAPGPFNPGTRLGRGKRWGCRREGGGAQRYLVALPGCSIQSTWH